MKLRERSPSANSERLAERSAQQDAEIVLLRSQLAQALKRLPGPTGDIDPEELVDFFQAALQ